MMSSSIKRAAIPFTIVKHRGGLSMAYKDRDGVRRKRALQSRNRDAALIEAYQVYEAMVDASLKAENLSIAQIWDAYESHLGERPAGLKMRVERQPITSFFGDFRPQDITDNLVAAYGRQRRNRKTGEPLGDGTLWTELGHLRDAINYAAKQGWIDRNDVRPIKRPQKPEPRSRYLTEAEIRQFLRAATKIPHLYLAIHLMLATGGRVSAVLELTWKQVDFERGMINLRLEDMQGKKPRAEVPMNATIRKVLSEAYPKRNSPHVVEWHGSRVKSIKTAWRHIIVETGLIGVSPHTLRHTAAVRMAVAGSAMSRISAFLGHTNSQTTERVYAKYSPEHLREEARALEIPDEDDR